MLVRILGNQRERSRRPLPEESPQQCGFGATTGSPPFASRFVDDATTGEGLEATASIALDLSAQTRRRQQTQFCLKCTTRGRPLLGTNGCAADPD